MVKETTSEPLLRGVVCTPTSSVLFSVIIPTYCRPARLKSCLEAMANLGYPPDCFEVLVVDDGGEPHPDRVISSFGDRFQLRLLKQVHSGPARARNTGAERAKGRFLAFTDDDCSPAPDWLQALANRFATAPDCAIGGHTINALPENLYSAASQMLIDYLYGQFNANPDAASFFASNNFAVPAEHFRAIGGFDTSFPRPAGEDREFCYRWLRCGYRMIYAPEAVVYHSHSLNFRTFWRQHFNYGRSAHSFRQVRYQRGQEKPSIEPLRFYLNLIRYPFLQQAVGQPFLSSVLLGVSQVANSTGFLWEKISG